MQYTKPIWIAGTDSHWFGQSWTTNSPADPIMKEEVYKYYQVTLQDLLKDGYRPVSEMQYFSKQLADGIDPFNQIGQVGWKQQFIYIGEFNNWLDKWKREQSNGMSL